MKTTKEGVIVIFNDRNEITGIIRKDESTRKNVIYSVSEMSLEEIEQTIKNEDITLQSEKTTQN